MDPFLGEIRLLPYSFNTVRGWMPCQGQLLPIRQYTALFSLLGTTYGGDGSQTFALPNLQGRAIVGTGQGPGLQNYTAGEVVGTESVTLSQEQLPAHIHGLSGSIPASANTGNQSTPQGGYYAANPSIEQYNAGVAGTMAPNLVTGTAAPAGGSQPHDNHMPYLALNYCIAVQGVFPQRQ